MTDDLSPSRETLSDGGTERQSVNEAVVSEWVEETTPFERVHEVARRTYEPESAPEIAKRARTSPTTARKHLRSLVETGAVVTTQDGQTTLYHRSKTALVTEHAEALLAEQTPEQIASSVAEMKTTIRQWQEEYGVDSPEKLARELDIADADSEASAVLTEWQTTRRNLALAEATLAIAEAAQSGALTGDRDDDGEDASALV